MITTKLYCISPDLEQGYFAVAEGKGRDNNLVKLRGMQRSKLNINKCGHNSRAVASMMRERISS